MSLNMEANDTSEKPKTIVVVLRDLQSLLRKSMGNELTVVRYDTENLLPKGENYGSTILKVEADIKKYKNSPIEKLHLVAKMTVATDFQKEHFNSTVSFVKEIFVFEELIPMYRKLQVKYGFDESDLIDVLPKFYGSRLSLNPNSKEADDDVVMLMENLKVKGYKTMDRKNGLDFHHAKLAAIELAKFHALGIACRQKCPEFLEEAKAVVESKIFKTTDEFDKIVDHMASAICEDPRLAEYNDQIKKSFKNGFEAFLDNKSPETIWSTFIHGDYWVNNLLFHHDQDGQVDDLKIVDFQVANYCSLTRDLPYFLLGNCNVEVFQNNFSELLDLYFDTFVKVLKNMKCSVENYSRKNFDDELKREAKNELCHCVMAVKFFTLDVDKDFDMNDMMSVVIMSKPSELYRERCYHVIRKFDEMKWF